MGEVLWLDAADERWDRLVARAAFRDVYDLASYHALAEAAGEGEARLLACVADDAFVALPLLVRPIPGAEAAGLHDAGSVYGYAGPLASADPPPPALAERFQHALREVARERGIVAVFSRLHPLRPSSAALLHGLGEVREHGSTVSIDLRAPEEAQAAAYCSNHRRDLAKARKGGLESFLDEDFRNLDAFVAAYHENMRRVGAGAYYMFPSAYFAGLRERLGGRLHLVACRRGGEFAGGALLTEVDGTVQYHLGAVRDEHLAAAPLKHILDAARRIFAARGAAMLHLGGGRGGAEDSLFRFKAGFSPRRHPFATWRWIARPEAYARLAAGRDAGDFFPAYRA